MLTRGVRALRLWLGLLPILLSLSCERVPLLAPTGSTINLTSSTNVLSADGTVAVIAQVMEASGYPPHSGTQVTFISTLGRMDPPDAQTDVNGRAVTRFIAGGSNGTATISAISGGATTGTTGALRLSVGSAAVGKVNVDANPAMVAATGGSSTITAVVLDVNGNPLSGSPVVFSTNVGTLSTSVVNADANGRASTVLTTIQEATVTASVGVTGSSGGSGGTGGTGGTTTPSGPQTATTTVKIAGRPSISITLPSTPPSKGLGASYTFVVTPAATNASPIQSVTVNWGDGTATQSLGTISGSQTTTHTYSRDDTFTITATVTDALGATSIASASVTVIPVASLGVVVELSSSPTNFKLVTARVQITVPAGLGVVSTRINWDYPNGSTESLGGFTGGTLTHVYPTAGTYTVVVSVTDTLGRTEQGTNTIVVQ